MLVDLGEEGAFGRDDENAREGLASYLAVNPQDLSSKKRAEIHSTLDIPNVFYHLFYKLDTYHIFVVLFLIS